MEFKDNFISIESEQAVLGGILLDNKSFYDCVEVGLKPFHFADYIHRKIYEKMEENIPLDKNFDPVTAKNWFINTLDMEIVGEDYLFKLCHATIGVSLDGYSRLIIENYNKRDFVERTDLAKAEFLKGDFDTNFEKFSEGVIRDENQSKKLVEANSIKDSLLQRMEDSIKGVGIIWSGYKELDRVLKGIKEGELIVIAGRAGMGKTAVSLNLANRIRLQGKKVAFFSMEMSNEELGERLSAINNGVELWKYSNPEAKYFDKRIEEIKALDLSNLLLNDIANLSVIEIETMLRKAKPEIAFIDYIGLIKSNDTSQSRAYEVEKITKRLKVIAKELKIPIILLAQLNRMTEQNKDKRPVLSNLRDSGALEQDANTVILLHRDKYYQENNDAFAEKVADKIELIVAKNRRGEIKTVELFFDGERQRIIERM